MNSWDVIVIGGGPAGENAAQYAIQGSERTAAIVEAELLGGECSYWACIPSKALVRPVVVLDVARAVEGVAEAVSGSLKTRAALTRRDSFTHHRDDAGHVEWAQGVGVEVIRGRGRLAGERTVEVTADDGTTSSLGHEEPFAGELIADRFAERGVTVLLRTEVEAVRRPEALDTGVGRIHGGPAEIIAGGSPFEVDEIVVGAGRTPASHDLGLDSVGIDVSESHGFLVTDDHMAVTGGGGWLYAVGDVCGRALLTHMGKYQARVAGQVIAARAEGRSVDGPGYCDVADHDIVPQVTFTDPEVASVGLTESDAREHGFDVETLEYDIASVDGAKLLREDYVGRAKLVVDRSTDMPVGATFVGSDVAELLHAATTAIVGKVTLERLWHAVPSFPTVSEVWLRLLESRGARASEEER